jgi:hypothetical protein
VRRAALPFYFTSGIGIGIRFYYRMELTVEYGKEAGSDQRKKPQGAASKGLGEGPSSLF